MSARAEKRDPVKEEPLPDPAESSKQRRDSFFESKVEFWALIAAFSVALAVMDWWRWITSSPSIPIVSTLLAFVLCALAFIRIWQIRPELARLDLGIKGERSVGQY
jgi:hypothetical protein